MRIGDRNFELGKKSYIMGILNVTPDSFSDGGQFNQPDRALERALQMLREGADIIDVGGESTRPGFKEVSVEEEIARVVPVIEKIKKETDAVISLDTWKRDVALAGIKAGADMINDIRGLRGDRGEMAALIARTGAAYCLMHNRESVCETNSPEEFLDTFCKDLDESLRIAKEAGIDRRNIILDPGIGFGKSYQQNLQLLKNLSVMNRWKLPVLLGTSRKSVIGLTLDLPPHERLEGTLATTVVGRMAGAALFRVHDVKENRRALDMADAILFS